MSAFDPTVLPRTRSVSPFHLGTPPQRQPSPAPASPVSSANDDTFVAPDYNARCFTFSIHFGAPPESLRTARGRSTTGVDDSFRSERAAPHGPTRAERIKLAGQGLIGTSAFAGAMGGWLIAGTPLIFAVIVAWLSYIVASAAFDFVASICLD